MKTLEEVKTLGRKLTGLKITTKRSEDTHFDFDYDIDTEMNTFKFVKGFINLNAFQIEDLCYELENRGFDTEYLYLQALLHEFAHYKQLLKLGVKKYLSLGYIDYSEDVADRFATIYYRRFIKERI